MGILPQVLGGSAALTSDQFTILPSFPIIIGWLAAQGGAPLVISWFIPQCITIVIFPINTRCWIYKPTQLTMGHHLACTNIKVLVCVLSFPHFQAVSNSCWLKSLWWLVRIGTRIHKSMVVWSCLLVFLVSPGVQCKSTICAADYMWVWVPN